MRSEIVGLILGACAWAFFDGCGDSGGKSPSEVVRAAYSAANEGKYSQADGHLSSDALAAAKGPLGTAEGGTKGIWDQKTRNGIIDKIEILGEQVRGEGAVVAYRLIFKDGQGREDRDPLIQEKGVWKITTGEAPEILLTPRKESGPSLAELKQRIGLAPNAPPNAFIELPQELFYNKAGTPMEQARFDANYAYLLYRVQEGTVQIALERVPWQNGKAKAREIRLIR